MDGSDSSQGATGGGAVQPGEGLAVMRTDRRARRELKRLPLIKNKTKKMSVPTLFLNKFGMFRLLGTCQRFKGDEGLTGNVAFADRLLCAFRNRKKRPNEVLRRLSGSCVFVSGCSRSPRVAHTG